MRCWASLLLLALGVLAATGAACVSSAPPAPPVRWFDPLIGSAIAPSLAAGPKLRVTSAVHIGQEFAVRVAPRELAFDSEHRWFLTPAGMVAIALERALGRPSEAGAMVEVEVEAFELMVAPANSARISLFVRGPSSVVTNGSIDVVVGAADGSPEALAAAMASALDEVGRRVQPH